MHISFFTDGYLPQLNGVATSIDLLTTVLEQKGQRVSIFAPRMGDYQDQRPDVYRFAALLVVPDPPLWLATPVSLRIYKQMSELCPDIIHSHSPFTMHALAYQVARRQHLPLVYTYHTLLPAHIHTAKILGRISPPARLAELYSAWTCNICDQVIAPSEKIKELLEHYGLRRPICVIHNGIEIGRFQGQASGFLRKRLGLSTIAKILLCVGRLTPEKNIEFLVKVLAGVVKQAENVYLVHVGQGPLKAQLQEQAAKLGIAQHLLFAGPLPPQDMPKVYADADIYVTASLSEVHSMAALEALAAGLPLVVVRDPSLALMVEDGQNGFVVALDKNAFSKCILAILADPERQARMRLRSRQIAAGFSVQAQAQKLIELYSQLIEYKRSHLR